VVNAESDFLSGLIVDKYAGVLVVQISSLGMEQRKPMIVEALQTIFSPRAIVERSDAAFRKFEGLPETNGLLCGTLEGPERIEMNGLKFDVDILGGHKTGLYLDQQRNYQLVAGLANQGQVLDCFSFLGGFGLHCARAGAAHVHAWTKAPRLAPPPRATPNSTAWPDGASKPPTFSTGSKRAPPSRRTRG
jgi:23S rRNA (cytosine1962-C5)-methyltransferase